MDAFRKRAKQRGFSGVEIMVVIAIVGVMIAIISPGVVNSRRMVKRRIDYIQFRDYLRATAFSFVETPHLEQPLLTQLDFTETDISYEDIKKYMGPMFYSPAMNGFAYPEMRYLWMLDFSSTSYDDRWTEHILTAPALTELHLSNTKITDATLHQLAGSAKQEFIYGRAAPMTKLKLVSLVACPNITPTGIKALQTALPNTEIIINMREQRFLDAFRAEVAKRMAGEMEAVAGSGLGGNESGEQVIDIGSQTSQ